jgi:GT2 family glycosyltransferase
MSPGAELPVLLIPTWRRTAQLRNTLHHLLACEPPPAGILVHVDAGDEETPAMLAREFAHAVRWVVAEITRGPGGGRDVLARMTDAGLLVSLDDDSWPEDPDFFRRAADMAARFPEAGVLACAVRQKGQDEAAGPATSRELASFENCGCAIRRSAYLQTRGFVPLRYAYGMEEVDVALQLLDKGWSIRHIPELRVFHDTDLDHHPSAAVNAAHISNTALFAFLRYPLPLWPLGLLQVLNRVRYAVGMGRFSGIVSGLMAIPRACWAHRKHRDPVGAKTILTARRLGRG